MFVLLHRRSLPRDMTEKNKYDGRRRRFLRSTVAYRLRPCDTNMRIVAIARSLAIQRYGVENMFVRFLRYDLKYALASDGVKTQSSRESEAASQRLRVWRAFSLGRWTDSDV